MSHSRILVEYLIVYLATTTYEGVALWRYCDNIFVIVERSGIVHVPSQLREPA